MKSEFEELIKGKSIVKHIKQDLTYRDMDDIQNIYSFMLMTGYLKAIGKEGADYQICLPNLEVHEIFKNTFVRYFQNFTSVRRNDFVHCLKHHDVNQAQSLLNQMLYHSLSYFDNHENFYHGFLVGLLQGYHIKSNREAGDGRFDLVIYGETIDDPCIVIECKHSETMRSLKADSERTARQIIDKRYIDEILDEGYLQCIGYGIAFCKKSCLITSVSSLT
ncbi:MAG: PD-(D/E)XK nuclease domain-containing protein [Merdibacter sp.]